MFVDHQIAMTLIGGFAGVGIGGGSPKQFIVGALVGFVTLGPMSYWLKLQGNRPGQSFKPANVFYTADCTKEETERFNHEDQIDMLAFQMGALPGYGYFSKDARHV